MFFFYNEFVILFIFNYTIFKIIFGYNKLKIVIYSFGGKILIEKNSVKIEFDDIMIFAIQLQHNFL